jgi:hypothetical protein
MSQVWIRRHNSSGSGIDSRSAGWALWGRANQQPWPHDEMARGFQYYICDQVSSRERHVEALATVTEYLPFTEVTGLGDAYDKLEPVIESSGLGMSSDEWLANEYNVEKLAQGRWPLQMAFWLIDIERVGPFWIEEIMDFRPGQTGWKRVQADRIPAVARR